MAGIALCENCNIGIYIRTYSDHFDWQSFALPCNWTGVDPRNKLSFKGWLSFTESHVASVKDSWVCSFFLLSTSPNRNTPRPVSFLLSHNRMRRKLSTVIRSHHLWRIWYLFVNRQPFACGLFLGVKFKPLVGLGNG